ncbi:unnamed protein product [Amoebophrya sp. A25]|nr:unnamed protein product [Amoebophrya sp. A25]|eukprot:GSA25T00027693001.1
MGGKASKAVALGVQWTRFKCEVESFFNDFGEKNRNYKNKRQEAQSFFMKARTFQHNIQASHWRSGLRAPKKSELFRGVLQHVFNDCRPGWDSRPSICEPMGKTEWKYEVDQPGPLFPGDELTLPEHKYDRFSKTVASEKKDDKTVDEKIIVDQLDTTYDKGKGVDVLVICVSYVRMIDGEPFSVDEVIFEHLRGRRREDGVWLEGQWRWRSPLSGKVMAFEGSFSFSSTYATFSLPTTFKPALSRLQASLWNGQLRGYSSSA